MEGWASAENCSYPQVLVLRIPSNDPVTIDRVSFLPHEFMIPQRIDIFVASQSHESKPSIKFDSCKNIRRLGYVLFDSNKNAEYSAKELKTVKIGAVKASALKFVISSCSQNPHNHSNQVSLVEISLFGDGTPHEIKNYKCKPFYKTPLEVDQVDSPKQRILSKAEKELEVKLSIMEREKKQRAAIEDYEGAALIKKALINAQSSFDLLREMNLLMLQAATEENYEEAQRLKEKRDEARESTSLALIEATETIGFSFRDDDIYSKNEESDKDNRKSNKSTMDAEKCSVQVKRYNDKIQELPSHEYSTHDQSNCSVVTEQMDLLCQQPKTKHSQILPASNTFDCNSPMKLEENCELVEDYSEPIEDIENHPLVGVPGFEALPDPRDVVIKPEHTVLSKRIEDILGTYRMKCLFSRNWALREAALTKTSLIMAEIKETHGIDKVAPTLCDVLERSLSDRIVQVFLTSLILLDDCLVEFEEANMPSRKVIPLMDKIIKCLMSKLAENKPKIVDGAETTLLSFALSSCIGPSHIGNLSVKELSSHEKKSGRGLCNRLRLIQKLLDEFGDEALTGKRVFEFVRGKSYHNLVLDLISCLLFCCLRYCKCVFSQGFRSSRGCERSYLSFGSS